LFSKDSYGYEINKAIRKKTDDQYELKEATLYSAFRRLEENHCIVSYWGDEATGARRRYYRITEQGKEAYLRLAAEWDKAKSLIDRLISREEETDGG